MTPTTEEKHPNTHLMSGYELAQRMGSPEFMSLSSLGKYVNRDADKYHFWFEKIHQGLVVPNMTHEEEKEAVSCGRYSYFSNFCEGM